MNSVYGKFGQKEHEHNIKLLDKKEADKIVRKYHCSYLAKISETKVIVKYGARLNEKLRQLYKQQEDDQKVECKINKDRGIPSSVQISAMIASNARMSINPLKKHTWELFRISNYLGLRFLVN